jgi:hypothetical protein
LAKRPQGVSLYRVDAVSVVAKSMLTAERETLASMITAVNCLMEGTQTMSRYQYLAHLTELASEIAQAKKTSFDEVFKTLATVPREKLSETVKRML